MKILLLSLLALFLGVSNSSAQSTLDKIQNFLNENRSELGLSESDCKNWSISDQHTDKNTNITHVYITQTYDDISVYNAIAVFALSQEEVIMTGNNLISNLEAKLNTTTPQLSAKQAVVKAAQLAGVSNPATPELVSNENGVHLYEKGEVSLEDIPVKLVWVLKDDQLNLTWDVSIYQTDAAHWWSFRLDASSGAEIDRVDWVTHCSFGESHAHNNSCSNTLTRSQNTLNNNSLSAPPPPPPATDQYNVFALPVESPNHGARSLVVGPFDATASPFGWHDTDGIAGAESTLTFGNNVRAYEDVADNNAPGYAPDGTAALDFDYPLNMNQAATGYQDPAITNLFYMNNMMHDIWYQYGFDEASGNFQENNYGNGGNDSDRVNAEAQDGSGFNNANFATPPDGNNPRMQMYLWNNPNSYLLTVNAPGNLAGGYNSILAGFGPALTATPITSDLVIYNDNTPDEYDACEVPVNAAAMNGNIVLIRRGSCTFVDKVQRAQDAGAIAVIMVNNVGGAPFAMGGASGTINIPSVMISDIDGEALIAEIEAGGTVNGTLVDAPVFPLDGDFDNGIIAHEYGHGISTRLTGGASSSNCLNNSEQMGEGWSDWFGIMLTIQPGDLATDNRGVGTFVTGESTSGVGIRPAPYNTDMAVNGFTYDATNNTGAISEPHGIGFVWCTMLWDLSWALMDQYGYDPNMHTGTGGNNIAMHLVIEGLKLQPCSPGFVDGRDAILQADQLLYGGIHECLIWNVFANRGLGYSADQGNANSRTDQVEAFDLPPHLQNVSGSETVAACGSYTWAANGVTYTGSGSYSQVLTALSGCDSTATLNLTITENSFSTQSIIECNTYLWPENGTTYTSSGMYTTTLPNSAGCDSIITLDLTITSSLLTTDAISACTQHTWIDGTTYTASNNTATHTLMSSTGCDSIITLDLTINTPTAATDVVVACDSYTWIDGNTYTANNNTATWTVTNAVGCDSLITLDLTINNASTGTDVITACDSYTWIDGVTYTASNNSATHTISNVVGCDSTVTLNLTINNSSTGTDVVSGCGSYLWIDGNTYTASNTSATHTLTNAVGCDSVVTLNLTMASIVTATDAVSACNSLTWIDGNTYSSSNNTATHTLTSVQGCDSIVTLDLTILTPSFGTDVIVDCESYTWIDGVTYTASNNTATWTITNFQGCDSVVTLDLTILNATSGTDVVTACAQYTWIDGNTYTADNNTATWNLTNIQGCDSTVTLDLTILSPSSGTDMINACGAYTWIDGNTYASSNSSATHTLTNAIGCDSIVTLDLTINSASSSTDQITACDSYTWMNGNTYTASNNTATHILTNAMGCDSVITLDLTITNTSANSFETAEACETYTWLANGLTYSSSGQFTETLSNVNGCDSTVILNLTIHTSSESSESVTACGTYTWPVNGMTYTSSGNFTETLASAQGCDSTLSLVLTIENVDNSASFIDDITLSANAAGATYQWIDCDNGNALISGETNQSFSPANNGVYAVIVTANNCSDTSECLTVSQIGIKENGDLNDLLVYPNPTISDLNIDLGNTYETVKISLINSLGQLIKTDEYFDIQLLEYSLNEAPGTYILEIQTNDGYSAHVRVVRKQ